ncbi:MAG: tetratricopeptide repeat protein [Isosphaeraceae bacterium]
MTKAARRRIVLVAFGIAALAASAAGLGVVRGWWKAETAGRSAAKSEDGGRGSRITMAIRSGRLDEALAACADPPGAALGADELGELGISLVGQDRLVLGWTALEASRRVAPNHARTAEALNELEGKLVMASGRELASRREAADEVEFLRGVRGGPALGLLALGLARFGDTPAAARELLDRILIRDRAELRAIDAPAGSLRLLARLLMETGRPEDAEQLLRPRGADAAGAPSSSSSIDREAAWLLSRAALQLGRQDEADAMLERAAGFGAGDSSPEPAPFVGSRKCAECHQIAFRAAQREPSPHARTLYLGASLKDIPLPDRPVPDPLDPHVQHGFTRKADDRIEMETRDEKGRVARAVVAYALGSGEHGITMVSRDVPGSTPRELRISYYTAEHAWRETKGVTALPHDPTDFIGLELSDKSLRQCLQCHTTWFRAALPIPDATPGPESADRGIGCERCHGPGLNHVKAIESGFAELAIGATRKSPPRRLLRSCNECHASNGTVEPSDPEFTRVQGTTLMFSRCFTGSDGAIHCATCHDPHRGLDTVRTHYEPKCLGCHNGKPAGSALGAMATAKAEDTAHGGAAGGGPAPPHRSPPVCPVNPASGCIDCHMPRVADPSLKLRFTDHHIRVHREPAAAPAKGG